MYAPNVNRQWNQAPSEVAYDDNTVIWEGRPSQWVNTSKILFWAAVTALALAGRHFWHTTWVHELPRKLPEHNLTLIVDYLALGAISIAIVCILYALLYVVYERTVITMNHVREEKGVTAIFRKIRYCELARVTDIHAPTAGLMAIVGIGDVVLEATDDDQPRLRIRGIRNRDQLVETLLPVCRAVRKERRGFFDG